VIERGDFKGKPVLIIRRDENDRYPFTFGLSKARLIVEHIEDIQQFVKENSQPQTEEPK
jgi:hypothetical protein